MKLDYITVNPTDPGSRQLRYQRAGVTFTIFLDSLSDTFDQVRNLPRPSLEALAVAYGHEVADYLTNAMLITLVGGYVQNDWYLTVKDAVPERVKDRHDERIANYEMLLKNPPPPADPNAEVPGPRLKRAPRAPAAAGQPARERTYVLLQAPAKPPGGQAALVLAALASTTAALTLAQVTALVVATGQLQTKQPPDRVVIFYLNEFRKKRWIDLGPEQVMAPAAEVAQAVDVPEAAAGTKREVPKQKAPKKKAKKK